MPGTVDLPTVVVVRGDRGQTSIEWLGVGVVTLAIIAVLAAFGPQIGAQVQAGFQRLVCQILNTGCGVAFAPAPPPPTQAPSGGAGAGGGISTAPEPRRSVADDIEDSLGEELSTADCDYLRGAFGPSACPATPSDITPGDLARLLERFGSDDQALNELNELACSTIATLPRNHPDARACAILRDINGTLAGDRLLDAIERELEVVVDVMRRLPVTSSGVDAVEAIIGETFEGDDLSNVERLLRVGTALGGLLPPETVRDLIVAIQQAEGFDTYREIIEDADLDGGS